MRAATEQPAFMDQQRCIAALRFIEICGAERDRRGASRIRYICRKSTAGILTALFEKGVGLNIRKGQILNTPFMLKFVNMCIVSA